MDKVVHFEIPADDFARANTFYSGVFGWGIQQYPLPDQTYYGVTAVPTGDKGMPKEYGGINGGIMAKDDTAKSPLIVIQVASVEEYVKKVVAAGGKDVMPARQVGGMGWYARVADTEGNIIGLWQDIPQTGAPAPTAPAEPAPSQAPLVETHEPPLTPIVPETPLSPDIASSGTGGV